MTAAHLDPGRRHDIVLAFDVTDGNPNGDPDASNQPRVDDETGHGLVTDVCIKRKIRDTVATVHGDDPRYGIFIEAGNALRPRADQARTTAPDDPKAWLCGRYFDLRMFGGVLTGGTKVTPLTWRGPLQLGFARSLDPVLPSDHAITRITQTSQEDIDKGETTEMGGKWTIPYGLYLQRWSYSAPLAAKTGVTSDDLAALWRAATDMFDHTSSAARGVMQTVGLWVFTHPDPYGVAPAGALARRIHIDRTDQARPARAYTDYQVQVRDSDLPAGITVTPLVNAWEQW